MLKALLLTFCFLFVALFTNAQSGATATKLFTVLADDNETALFTLQIPAESKINKAFNFLTYITAQINLLVSYELDDEPSATVSGAESKNEIDLLKYARGLTAATLADNNIQITKKIIAPKVEVINGVKTLLLQYDYTKTITGQKTPEQGNVFLYLLPVKASSMVNEASHNMVVRLQFDFKKMPGAAANDALQKDIISTLKSVAKVK